MPRSSRKHAAANILVDCSNYFLDNENMGDLACFHVMVKRLRNLWPQATIQWITLDADIIHKTLPGIRPLALQTRHGWLWFRPRDAGPGRRLTRWTALLLSHWLRQAARRQLPELIESSVLRVRDWERLLQAARSADLVLALGGGAFSDSFPAHARGLLDTLDGGLAFGKPTALLSAGFEQVTDPALMSKARSVLPRLQLITCRENLLGPSILKSYNVPAERCRVTGDEAIELAHQLRAPQLGTGIGVNLRRAYYAGFEDDSFIVLMRAAIQKAGRRHNAVPIPIPISMRGPSDPESIRNLLRGCRDDEHGGAKLETPQAVIGQAGRCRLVVTGSYHSAVFALSQGIPVVALADSYHYLIKLQGLAAQFREGCNVIEVRNQPGLESLLDNAIEQAWEMAPHMRSGLLQAAQEQIEAGRTAYKLLQDMVA